MRSAARRNRVQVRGPARRGPGQPANRKWTNRFEACADSVVVWRGSDGPHSSHRSQIPHGVQYTSSMSHTVFLGNLPTWVTADDITSWLRAENLVADSIKVIRNPETQESRGFAFIETPNEEEMNSIIRRFDRAPLEERLLRANQAQPPRSKGQQMRPAGPEAKQEQRPPRRGGRKQKQQGKQQGPQSAFAQELAKAL